MTRIVVLARARSGSTAFMELLGSHPHIQKFGELLNETAGPLPTSATDLCDFITEKLNAGDSSVRKHKAFKVLTEQLRDLKLNLDFLMHRCQIETAIVVWRKEAVEAIASAKIANATGLWYSNHVCEEITSVPITEDFLRWRLDEDELGWTEVFEQWPIEVRPIFVQYEWLFENGSISDRMRTIFAEIGIADCCYAECYAKKQNPAPLHEKITNWSELPVELREKKIDVPALFESTLSRRFGLPPEIVAAFVPDREPRLAPGASGFRIRVAEPFLPQASIDNVADALGTGSISSAGVWPQKLAQRLRDLFQLPFAIPCCNGFASLVLALQSANISTNDDVILPSLTMVAVPNAIAFVGARPIFVDCETGEYNPTWAQIEAAATTATKAVIIAHSYGCPARDIELIAEGCRHRRWALIEDISECVGIKVETANGTRLLGTFGDYACASMYANKIVHAGDGGFLLARNAECGVRLTSINNHGFTKSFHFVHFESSINGKINGLGAAVACGVLDNLDHIMAHRAMLAQRYREKLSAAVSSDTLQLMPHCGVGDTPWVFGIHCQTKKQRTELRQHLAYHGIETRDYFFPLHLQPAFTKKLDGAISSLPNAEQLGSTAFYLPTHTNLTEATIDAIAAAVCSFFNNNDSNSYEAVKATEEKQCISSTQIKMKCADIKAALTQQPGSPLHQKARQCFEGAELWDDKKALVEEISKHCSETKVIGKVERILLAYHKYFSATMHVDAVSRGGLKNESIETVFEGMGKTVQNVLYIGGSAHYNEIAAIAKSRRLHCDAIDFPENGTPIHLNGHAKDAKGMIVINFDAVNEEQIEKLERLFDEYADRLRSQKILLLGVTEKHLHFLAAVTQSHVLSGKINDMRLLEPGMKAPEADVEWEEVQTLWNQPLQRKMKFIGDPDWDHHHQNAFHSAIAQLKSHLHDENAQVLFVAAIEQYICDAESTPQQPWIGIIHSIRHAADHFYVPDLYKLCTKVRFRPCLRRCRGLLTLTSDQADYLKQHLRPQYNFPIIPVHYPCMPPLIQTASAVPRLLQERENKVDVYFIGSFDRDFQHFFDAQFPKSMQKVLLVCDWQTPTTGIPDDVKVIDRVENEEYERILSESIVFLSLNEGGAANTLVIECIARNTPIVAPRLQSIIDYIGESYPLLYTSKTLDFTNIITPHAVDKAIAYLQAMDKSHLSQANFVNDIVCSSVLQSLPPFETDRRTYDVTITICSYKRTQHLREILDSLLNKQNFEGYFEIIVWNNNRARQRTVEKIVNDLQLQISCNRKRLELISSSENHCCSVRFAMPQLMRSDTLLICDDDVIPGTDFIDFFLRNHRRHPKDVLCLRGNYFLPHEEPKQNAHKIWTNYDCVRFVDDDADERLIHYVHADACLIPKAALREVAAVEPPDADFMLIDDYWMSYVLAAKYGRSLRKLKACNGVITRTADSDEIGLAMHTRSDVANARTRMYLHHMCAGWPNFTETQPLMDETLKQFKRDRWSKHRMGININSEITPGEIDMLLDVGVSFVRIGVVGAGRDEGYEFCDLNQDKSRALDEIENLVRLFADRGIDIVIVADSRVATETNWQAIADRLGQYNNVVGYDLFNEPFTEQNQNQHWMEVKSSVDVDSTALTKQFTELIQAVRSRDCVTPIIVESPFWANIATLHHLEIEELKKFDDNFIASVHFYLPQALTWRTMNRGRFAFPGEVPVYEKCIHSETIFWSPERIEEEFDYVERWTTKTGIKVFVGEFGISRDIVGADLYLQAVAESCRKRNLSACLYAFRDPDWEVMDYELGVDAGNHRNRSINDDNQLYKTIRKICALASVDKGECA